MSFELWRQDDNGQQFLIGRYPTLDAAERSLAALTRSQHKQTYWIIEIETAGDAAEQS